MIKFPDTTLFNKKIPKNRFYSNLSISKKVEKMFVDEIESVYWKYKLSSETLNVNKGNDVLEIELLEINLKNQNISERVLEIIDREIPYHIVFLLLKGDYGKLTMSYKEISKKNEKKFKVDTYFSTKWKKVNDIELNIDGLDLDKIYENFLYQIGENKLQFENIENIKQAVEKSKEIESIKKEISILKKKLNKEKQIKKQSILWDEIRSLKEQLSKYEEGTK